jgi:protein involved in polysaccharide export with SLBB domain
LGAFGESLTASAAFHAACRAAARRCLFGGFAQRSTHMHLPWRAWIHGGVSAAAIILAGCATDSVTAMNPQIPIATSTAQLRPGDSLNVALQGVPDASNNAVQVDEQGLISLPYIGTVAAAGLGTAELSQRVRETYIAKKIYTNVDVSVSVTERYIYVGGEVQRPGRIIWTPDLTVAKAIQSAGGFTLYAKETAVNLVREKAAYPIDVKLAQRNPAQDPRLVPGDSLQVPRSPF